MRNEVARLEALLEQQKEKTAGSSNDKNLEVDDRGSEDQSVESDEDEEYLDILPETLAKK